MQVASVADHERLAEIIGARIAAARDALAGAAAQRDAARERVALIEAGEGGGGRARRPTVADRGRAAGRRMD
jgi:hypothetical protein